MPRTVLVVAERVGSIDPRIIIDGSKERTCDACGKKVLLGPATVKAVECLAADGIVPQFACAECADPAQVDSLPQVTNLDLRLERRRIGMRREAHGIETPRQLPATVAKARRPWR